MENIQYIFRRVEKKYFITKEKADALRRELGDRILADVHGKSTINSLYLDTDSFLLIRNSMSAREYKEKLRLRSYGEMRPDGKVFFEIKKKYKGVVYKRRVDMTCEQALEYIKTGQKPIDSQIMREIDYAMKVYGKIHPSLMISCEREAYYFAENPSLRLTFDYDIRYSVYPSQEQKRVIDSDGAVMELKCDGAIPPWLSLILNSHKIYPSSFSKYGRSYIDLCNWGNEIKEKVKTGV
jgi:SPX domain protein involved in polyphosphate accumulation